MTEEEEGEDNFQFDQPWNPVSYFEEENEATGGNASGTAYSPSKLASLFETNKLAVDQDILMRKRHDSRPDNSEPVILDTDENKDLDTLSEYTLELEDGMKILDTTPAINRKAIYHDIDRLRRWRESIDKPNKDVYINDIEFGDYSSGISTSSLKENENNIDLNVDYILESLPDVTTFGNENANMNSLGKKEGENQHLVGGDSLVINTNSQTLNPYLEPKCEKKIDDREDKEVITNSIKLDEMLNGNLSLTTVSDLNRKNLQCETCNDNDDLDIGHVLSTVSDGFNLANHSKVISHDLDDLFDDTDEVFELPDVPQHLGYICSENGTGIMDMDCVIANNSASDNDAGSRDIIEIHKESSNTLLEEILSSKTTDDIDTLIDEAEAIAADSSSMNDDCNKNDLEIKEFMELNHQSPTGDDENGILTQEKLLDAAKSCNEEYGLNESNEVKNEMKSKSNLDLMPDIETTHEANEGNELSDGVSPLPNLNTELTKELDTASTQDVQIQPANLEPDNEMKPDSYIKSEPMIEADVDTVSLERISEDVSCEKDEMLSSDMNISESLNTPCNKEIVEIVGKEINELNTPTVIDNNNGSRTDNDNLADTTDLIIEKDINSSICTCIAPIQVRDPDNKDNSVLKQVDVSAVHCKDSIGCLTPDEDEEEILVALAGCHSEDGSSSSSGNISANNNNNGCIEIEESTHGTENGGGCSDETSEINELFPSLPAEDDISEKEEMLSNDVAISSSPLLDTDDGVDLSNGHSIISVEEEVIAGMQSEEHVINHTNNNLITNTDLNMVSALRLESNCTLALTADSNEPAVGSCVVVDPAFITDDTYTPDLLENIEAATNSAQSRTSSTARRVRFSLNHEDNSSTSPHTDESTSNATNSEDVSTHESENQNTGMLNLGWIAPTWIPDCDAKSCMMCNLKFTVVKRRHHCRACGKVLCSQCCNMKYHLPYMDYKPARVCQTCFNAMINALNGSPNGETQTSTMQQQQPVQLPNRAENVTLPEAPPPYSETVDGLSERVGCGTTSAPPYSEIPAPRFDEQPAPILPANQSIENLPVMRTSYPNANITDMMSFQLPSYSTNVRSRTSRHRSESEMSAVIMFNSTVTNLPPILRRENEETRIVNNPDLDMLMKKIHDEEEDPVSFIVNKNLVVRVKIVNMDCCVEKKCWCFVSDGMGASNQEEVVILIKYDSYDIDDWMLTRKVLQQMNAIFEKAKHGNAVSDSEQMEFNPNIMCTPKNVAMLFYKPTLQCLKKLFLPTSPYLFGLYIEKSEFPWARNFPLRLLLRIGAEFKYYPCPLFNVLDRPAVYSGVGRTILDLLADFRNYQYTLPRIVGVTINLQGKDTILKLPRHRFDEVLKVVNSAEENVLSLAGNFSPSCDGHLVSVEKDGRYKTQTLSIVLKENRKATCASFFVMSAALKPDNSGIKAKASIVEDGVMVQVTSDVIQEFKTSIKEMKDYTVTVGIPGCEDSSLVSIEWCTGDSIDRPKLTSPIDATPFDNLTNMKIRHSYDYTSSNLTAKIHWVEVYFLPHDNDTTVQRLSARELGQMTSSIAKACMSALSPHLMTLIALEMTRIGLRVNLAANFVEYKIGSNLTSLPAELLPTLDDKLVPAVHNVMSSAQERVAVELIFQLVKIV